MRFVEHIAKECNVKDAEDLNLETSNFEGNTLICNLYSDPSKEIRYTFPKDK